MQYFWKKPILTINGNNVVFKGGESAVLTKFQIEHLITEKALEDNEFRQMKVDVYQAHVIELYDQLCLTLAEFVEGQKSVEHTMEKKRMIAITTALWVAGRSGESGDEYADINSLTYQDIAKFLPKGK